MVPCISKALASPIFNCLDRRCTAVPKSLYEATSRRLKRPTVSSIIAASRAQHQSSIPGEGRVVTLLTGRNGGKTCGYAVLYGTCALNPVHMERLVRNVTTSSQLWPQTCNSCRSVFKVDKGTQHISSPEKQSSPPAAPSSFACHACPLPPQKRQRHISMSGCKQTALGQLLHGHSSGTDHLSAVSSDHTSTQTSSHPPAACPTWWMKIDSGEMN